MSSPAATSCLARPMRSPHWAHCSRCASAEPQRPPPHGLTHSTRAQLPSHLDVPVSLAQSLQLLQILPRQNEKDPSRVDVEVLVREKPMQTADVEAEWSIAPGEGLASAGCCCSMLGLGLLARRRRPQARHGPAWRPAFQSPAFQRLSSLNVCCCPHSAALICVMASAQATPAGPASSAWCPAAPSLMRTATCLARWVVQPRAWLVWVCCRNLSGKVGGTVANTHIHFPGWYAWPGWSGCFAAACPARRAGLPSGATSACINRDLLPQVPPSTAKHFRQQLVLPWPVIPTPLPCPTTCTTLRAHGRLRSAPRAYAALADRPLLL